MKTIIEALEFCKENKLYDKHIKIALGINKVPMTIKEGLNQLRMKE
jgi:chromosome segregation and condensation protein ScpB